MESSHTVEFRQKWTDNTEDSTLSTPTAFIRLKSTLKETHWRHFEDRIAKKSIHKYITIQIFTTLKKFRNPGKNT